MCEELVAIPLEFTCEELVPIIPLTCEELVPAIPSSYMRIIEFLEKTKWIIHLISHIHRGLTQSQCGVILYESCQ